MFQQLNLALNKRPNIENSINLSKSEVDRYDIPRINLKWKIREDVFRTLKITLEKLGQETIEKNVGRVGIDKYVYNQTFKDF